MGSAVSAHSTKAIVEKDQPIGINQDAVPYQPIQLSKTVDEKDNEQVDLMVLRLANLKSVENLSLSLGIQSPSISLRNQLKGGSLFAKDASDAYKLESIADLTQEISCPVVSKRLFEYLRQGQLHLVQAACEILGVENIKSLRFTNLLTPLHVAALHGHVDIVKYLLCDIGIDNSLCDGSGRTAFDWAVLCDQKNVAMLLLDAGNFGVPVLHAEGNCCSSLNSTKVQPNMSEQLSDPALTHGNVELIQSQQLKLVSFEEFPPGENESEMPLNQSCKLEASDQTMTNPGVETLSIAIPSTNGEASLLAGLSPVKSRKPVFAGEANSALPALCLGVNSPSFRHDSPSPRIVLPLCKLSNAIDRSPVHSELDKSQAVSNKQRNFSISISIEEDDAEAAGLHSFSGNRDCHSVAAVTGRKKKSFKKRVSLLFRRVFHIEKKQIGPN